MSSESRESRENGNQVNSSPLVSVIIPTRNSSRTLRKCLESVSGQKYRNIETLVIDSDSQDNTIEIAKTYGAKIFRLFAERTIAKNWGVQRAKGDFVLFLDSDMMMESGVVSECVERAQNENVGGLIIPERTTGTGFWTMVRDFERSFYAGTKIESARFFYRNIVLEVGGFDEDLVTYEESTLPQKIALKGYKTDARIDSYILHDEGRLRLTIWLSKKRYYAESLKLYKERYKEYSHYQLNVRMRAGLFIHNGNWIKLIKHPPLTTGLVILKILELLSSRKT